MGSAPHRGCARGGVGSGRRHGRRRREDEGGGGTSGCVGAQTDQLRAQAEACRRSSGALHDLLGTASALIAAVEWSGPDADAFRECWAVEARARLTERAEVI